MKSQYEIIQERVLSKWPGVVWKRAKAKRHNMLVVSFAGQTRKLPYPVSPSDKRRGALNHAGDISKTLRALGAERRG